MTQEKSFIVEKSQILNKKIKDYKIKNSKGFLDNLIKKIRQTLVTLIFCLYYKNLETFSSHTSLVNYFEEKIGALKVNA